MQPSSDQNGSAAPGSGAMRRYGPIAAILAVVAIVVGVVAFSGGDDDDDGTDGATDSATDTTGGGGDVPEGAIPFSLAEEEGIVDELTWPEACDLETGLVKIPHAFAPEPYADVEDNGGATAPGVTADTIKVVVYLAPESDAVLDFIQGPINADDTNEDVKQTYQGFTDMYNAVYQTYGRKVELEFLQASGASTD